MKIMKTSIEKPAEYNDDFSVGSDDDSEDYIKLNEIDRTLLSGSDKFKYKFKIRHQRFVEDCLEAHNRIRELHLAAALKLDKKLCRECRIWARYLANQGQLESRYNNPYGENLFLVWPTNVDYTVKGAEPVEFWYSGMQDYTFGLDPTNLLCLQFTQLVWRDSTKLGVGIARGDDGKIFVVANYEPGGNVMGEFTAQVPPPGGFREGAQWRLSSGRAKARRHPFTSSQCECLQLHNDLRRRHGVPLLTLNAALSKMATAWAQQLAQEDRHAYQVDNPVGENVFSVTDAGAQVVGVNTAVETWYKEMKFFDFGMEPFDIKARNFTQMLWRSSRYLGVGVERGMGGRVVVVANYYPRGNVVGQYRDNVPPPRPLHTVVPATTVASTSTSVAERTEELESQKQKLL